MNTYQAPIGSDDLNRISDKIRKLMALAGNNPSEAEAAAAMAKAQELLAAYNLDMAQLDQSRPKTAQEQQAGTRTKEKVERSAMFVFQRQLWQALAETNFCVYWSTKVFHESGIYSTHHHFLIGREDNVATVKVMGEYLEKAINRLCPYKVGKDVHLWKMGAVERICQRLRDKMAEMVRTPAPASANGQPSTAIALKSVFDMETHGNYLFSNPTGTWCLCNPCILRRRAEREAAMAAIPEAVDNGQSVTVVPPHSTETAAQKRQREAREQRSRDRYWDQQSKKDRERRAVRESAAFQQGVVDGGKVGLDTQVSSNRPKSSE